MLREIVLDTETTGLDARNGDRIIEIGCVELVNHIPSGQNFHVYLNPERPVAPEAVAVHGLTDAFLADKPRFAEAVSDFLAFMGEARLVIHNAAFDISFINAEFARLGLSPVRSDLVVDTLQIARRRHPAGPNSLDALCARYGIDNSRRTKHGALLDAEILAEVYLELIGGRQAGFDLETARSDAAIVAASARRRGERPAPLAARLDAAQVERHRAFVAGLGPKAIWTDFADGGE
jgi:DNA polymerase-3 subunit epsilon